MYFGFMKYESLFLFQILKLENSETKFDTLFKIPFYFLNVIEREGIFYNS